MLNQLEQLKLSLAKQDLKGLALDIDETLSYTVFYWFSRMQKLFGNPENLSVEEMITKYRYSYHVPYWKSREVDEWIDIQLHSNDVQKDLPLITGADEYVQKIHQVIPIVAYITARPDVVIPGTRHWLEKHQLPDVPIIARPRYVVPPKSNRWKAAVLQHVQNHVVGIIDDNPGLIEHLDDYHGTIFLYNYRDQVESDAEVITCNDWSDTLDKVTARYT